MYCNTVNVDTCVRAHARVYQHKNMHMGYVVHSVRLVFHILYIIVYNECNKKTCMCHVMNFMIVILYKRNVYLLDVDVSNGMIVYNYKLYNMY